MAFDQADQSERQQTQNVLRTFVGPDGRLARLPEHFETGVEYPERLVDERLRVWCEVDAEAA
ncbi:hypothetical protein [Streptomyces geranii]|uniref:hypothetical protein n=1 Tax=Streptomyces geranii TaxID=2058923 RepID=UPI000D03F912|nr:hypothetical protein [Streptomyces geranii]